MVAVAQLGERRIVAPKVARAGLVSHPIKRIIDVVVKVRSQISHDSLLHPKVGNIMGSRGGCVTWRINSNYFMLFDCHRLINDFLCNKTNAIARRVTVNYYKISYRGIAQLVEQRSPKPKVQGSSPCAPANAEIAA